MGHENVTELNPKIPGKLDMDSKPFFFRGGEEKGKGLNS